MLAKVAGTITVPGGDQGGAMTNGVNHVGSTLCRRPGHLDVPGLVKTTTSRSALGNRPSAKSIQDSSHGFGWSSPTGVLLDSSFGARVAQISVNAPLSGTYTVIVGTADTFRQAAGNYLLTLAKIPDAVTVPLGDEGGAMTNGANHLGHIHVGDLDQWTFQANKDEYITLSAGEPPFGEVDPGFFPWIRLVGPTGVLLDSAFGARVAQVDINAPLTGTYTVIVGTADTFRQAEGNYKLTLAKFPGTVTVPDGDQGGPLLTGPITPGQILVGDLDQWTFQATQNDYIALSTGEPAFGEVDPGFFPWIRLVGPTGVVLDSSFGARVAQISINAPLTGKYTVIIGTADTFRQAEGNYELTLAKMPGAYSVTTGDQGGTMLNLVPVFRIDLRRRPGSMDVSRDQACRRVDHDPPNRRLGNRSGVLSVDPRSSAPLGCRCTSTYGTNSAAVTFTPTLSGDYTVIVGTADTFRQGSGSYVRSGTGITSPGFTVTPSAGANGSINPNAAQEVPAGGTTSFTVTPSAGFTIAGVGGTCGGTLVGQVFTTGPVNADCTVIASFTPS